MTDRDTFAKLRVDLFQPKRGLYVVPIRHHSPSCAWALRRLIRDVKPTQVLVEAPADFAPQIPLLLDAQTKPPVALVALVKKENESGRVAGYYPFCAHSPEFVALQEGQAIGADLQFIDAPAADKAARGILDRTEPVSLLAEHPFDSNDYVAALARRTGCRDGFELWDHLFETRLGDPDWQSFFGDVGVYCAGIRSATSPDQIKAAGDDNREAHMTKAVAKALANGGPVVVVVGGFHAPALVEPSDGATPEQVSGQSDCYLIRYGFRAMDALNGYVAGLPQPGYYQKLWAQVDAGKSSDELHAVGIDLVTGFTRKMRADGHTIPLPAQVEAIRIAESLARLRGRPVAMRHDLIDGIKAALVKGETTTHDIWVARFEAFMCGDDLGDVPASAGSPPLVEDIRARARRHRMDLSDSAPRRRKLDIRRKSAHLEASRFLHATVLLGCGFATREAGPDYLTGVRTELLFEEWRYTWSPQVEGRLIELAVLGDELPVVCLASLHRERAEMIAEGRARDLPMMIDLLIRGLQAGLGSQLAPFVELVSGDIQSHGTFATVTAALQRLMFVLRSAGPLGAPETLDLRDILGTAFSRLVYLCDDLPDTSNEQIDERLDALRTINEILRDCAALGLDRSLLDDALDRVADDTVQPVILGALLAVCVQSGQRQSRQLARIMQGQFSGVRLDTVDQIGVLRGVLHTCPSLLWHVDQLLQVVDTFLCDIPEDQFLDLLPHLRLAFTSLNPRETDRLAETLSGIHNIQAGEFQVQPDGQSEADVIHALAVEKAVREGLKQDGLLDWIGNEGTS